jgi:hypothetical protein
MIAARTHRRKLLLAQSAVTLLALCVWIGPNRTLFFLMLIAIGCASAWIVRRHPLVDWGVLGFVRGLLGR